jgi:hypothetical protein
MPWAPVDRAVLVGLGALLALAAGIRLALGRSRGSATALADEASPLDVIKVVQLHLGLVVALELAWRLASIPGLFQALTAFAQLRYATLFVLGMVCVLQRRGHGWFAALVAAEIIVSMGGFFAGFRLPLFVAFLVYATRIGTGARGRWFLLAGLGGLILYAGVVWSAIKGDYRDIASGGTGEQAVVIDRGDQFQTLISMWSGANDELLERGAESLARRLAYVDFLAYTLQYVPNTRPHTEGEVWLAALRHVSVPRLVWPAKPELRPDTDFTREFTGLGLYSASRDTSISIGYVGDTYIDFGEPGMYFALGLLGFATGLLYRALLAYVRGAMLLRYGVLVCVFLMLSSFEVSFVKLLGGLLFPWIVAFVGLRFFGDELTRWIQRPAGAAGGPR